MIIKYGKRDINVDVEAGETVETLKSKLMLTTDCKFIKLILSGSHLKNEDLISNLPGGSLAKIVMVATEKNVDVHAPVQIESIRDDLTAGATGDVNSGANYNAKRVLKAGRSAVRQYGFGGVETLPGYKDREKAREILESLANDPGILAAMKKRKFFVPVLRELPPDGYVGVSDVCLMGLNENFGQRISLRIRTDDLMGFRKILSIKKVLCHELAHNIHGPHDDKFYVLMRQIEKDVDELDWTKSSGHKAGGAGANAVYRHSGSSSSSSSSDGGEPMVYKLGGESVFGSVDAISAAGAAAVMRYAAEEKEIEYSCGSGRGSSSSSSRSNGAAKLVIDNESIAKAAADIVADCKTDCSDNLEINDCGPMRLAEETDSISNSNSDLVVSGARSFEHSEGGSATSAAASNPIVNNAVSMEATLAHTNNNDNTASSYHVDGFLSQITLFIDETIANAYSLDTPQTVIDKLSKLQEEIQQLIVGNDWEQKQDREKGKQQQMNEQRQLNNINNNNNNNNSDSKLLGCFKLLHKIVLNAKDCDSPKYRSIKTSTKTFQSIIAARTGAVGILNAVGFNDSGNGSDSASGSGDLQSTIELKRDDPGLLYIAASVLGEAVDLLSLAESSAAAAVAVTVDKDGTGDGRDATFVAASV